ncbi:NAD(P)-dependent oxidoreductase [Arthrobacter sp. AFG20]|jgi:3-hydroxyisobutyrate dehydrogenase-like beta-hydroxyacid dehydrogenase|nr:NAD(P)-dependent oxidoreductase [Arthrobacter sp. AFG20]PNH82985.1 NAD(P)-dependent oxidoreductase [Arthrobacter sp. AFG20]SLK17142.1 3-hydroxyisobutyrate dehydrogenase [Arthrobacter sp. P2b]
MNVIAVVGLGHMGGAVARRLDEKFEVVGFDAAEGARERAGVTTASTLDKAVSDADIVFTSLPNDSIVRDVWLGPGGLVAAAREDAIVVELSTIMPTTMRDIASAATGRGVRSVDCPVSGGPGEAETGRLSLLVGGDDATIDAVSAALEQLGTIRRTGDLGTGKVVKIVNNMMSMANVLAASEAFSLGCAAGVDPQRLFDVLSVSGGTSQHFTKRWPKALAGDFTPGFTISLGEKDLALGMELARSLRVPSPVAATGREIYQMAMLSGLADQDIVALQQFYDSWSSERASKKRLGE